MLAKLSASPEVAVGFPIAGAATPPSMSWWGFSSTPWCCGSISAVIPPLPSCWPRCDQRSLAAYENQDVPFEVLVERLNPTRTLTHHPLVQVVLAWHNLPGHTRHPRWTWARFSSRRCRLRPRPPAWTWIFSWMNAGMSPGGPPASRGGGVSHRRVRRGQHRGADRAVAAGARGDDRRPHRRLSSIDLLDAPEHARLDQLGNRAALTHPQPRRFDPGAVRRPCRARPGAVAITCEGHSMTYRDLDQAANRLAHRLAGQAWARDSMWRCCFRDRLRRSWRWWRSSNPGRPTWPSTRGCLRRGSGSCSPTPRRSPRSPPPGWPAAGRVRRRSSMSTTPH